MCQPLLPDICSSIVVIIGYYLYHINWWNLLGRSFNPVTHCMMICRSTANKGDYMKNLRGSNLLRVPSAQRTNIPNTGWICPKKRARKPSEHRFFLTQSGLLFGGHLKYRFFLIQVRLRFGGHLTNTFAPALFDSRDCITSWRFIQKWEVTV
jgi:hypothetical protein